MERQTEEGEVCREGGIQAGSPCAVPHKRQKATPSVLRPPGRGERPGTCRPMQRLFSPCCPSSGLEHGQCLEVKWSSPCHQKNESKTENKKPGSGVLADAGQPQSAKSGFLLVRKINLHSLKSLYRRFSVPHAAGIPDRWAGGWQEFTPSFLPRTGEDGAHSPPLAGSSPQLALQPAGTGLNPSDCLSNAPLSTGPQGHSIWVPQKGTHTFCSDDKQAKQPATQVTPLSPSQFFFQILFPQVITKKLL